MPSEIRIAVTVPSTDDKRAQALLIAKIDPILQKFEADLEAAGVVGAKALLTGVSLRPEKAERKPVVVQSISTAPPARDAAD